MYEQVFNFSNRPFTPMPYVGNYFPNQSIQSALSQARLCIDRASGPVVVIGGEGSGKSLLLQILREEYDAIYSAVLLDCARLARREDLFQNILFELDQEYRNMSEGELRLSLMDFLRPGEQCPNGMLLLVDEAESLPQELLDEIRRITNLVRNGEPRVRLVLAGNQRFEEHLAEWKLGSFISRIAARCYLQPMTRAETREYVAAHIQRVGGDWENIFAEDSLKEIHALSDGCPRVVNQICEHALLLGASEGVKSFDAEFVKRTWASLQNLPTSPAIEQRQFPTKPAVGEPVAAVEFNKSEDDESWTVIEFGELHDEPAAEDSGATDGTNSPAESPTVDAFSADSDVSDQRDCIATPTSGIQANSVDGPGDESEFEPDLANGRAEDEVVSDLASDELKLEAPVEAEVGQDELTAGWHGVEESSGSALSNAQSEAEDKTDWAVEEFGSTHGETQAEGAQAGSLDESLDVVKSTDSQPTDVDRISSSSAPDNDWHSTNQLAESGYSQVDTSTSCSNPFDEEFESTESVVDRFMPVFVEQNVSSLTVTKSDLEAINPEAENCENHGTCFDGDCAANSISPVILQHSDTPSDWNHETESESVSTSEIELEAPLELSNDLDSASWEGEYEGETNLGDWPEVPSSERMSLQDSNWESASDSFDSSDTDVDTGARSCTESTPAEEASSSGNFDCSDESISMDDSSEIVQRETPLTIRANAETVPQSELQEVLESLQQPSGEEDVRHSLENLIEKLSDGDSTSSGDDASSLSEEASFESRGVESETPDDSVASESAEPGQTAYSGFENGDDDFGPGTIVDDAFIERRADEVLRSLESHGLNGSANDSERGELPHSVGPEVTHIALESLSVDSSKNNAETEPESDDDFGVGEASTSFSEHQNEVRGQLDDLFRSTDNENNIASESSVVDFETGEESVAEIANQLSSVFGGSDKPDVQDTPVSDDVAEASSNSNDYEEGILSEIESIKSSAVGDGEASIPLEYSLGSSDGSGMPTDDRDMLIVSRTEQRNSPTETPEPELDTSPPSTGKAKRMDYQALFDQLRNITDEST